MRKKTNNIQPLANDNKEEVFFEVSYEDGKCTKKFYVMYRAKDKMKALDEIQKDYKKENYSFKIV